MTSYILIIYLSTFSMNSGMTMTEAGFYSQGACESAEVIIKKEFNGMSTQVRTVCVKQ